MDTYATLIHDLTDELAQARAERDEALGELDRLRDGVEVLADHRRVPPHSDTFTCS